MYEKRYQNENNLSESILAKDAKGQVQNNRGQFISHSI